MQFAPAPLHLVFVLLLVAFVAYSVLGRYLPETASPQPRRSGFAGAAASGAATSPARTVTGCAGGYQCMGAGRFLSVAGAGAGAHGDRADGAGDWWASGVCSYLQRRHRHHADAHLLCDSGADCRRSSASACRSCRQSQLIQRISRTPSTAKSVPTALLNTRVKRPWLSSLPMTLPATMARPSAHSPAVTAKKPPSAR